MSVDSQSQNYEIEKLKHRRSVCMRGGDELSRLSFGCSLGVGLVAGFISLSVLMPCNNGVAEAADPPLAASALHTGSDKGIHWREISLDEFARADSVTPVPANVTAYLTANKCKDQDGFVSLIETAQARAERAGFKPPSLLLACCIVRWETGATWNIYARGKAGERGPLQIHPIHDGSMKAAGLDPLDVDDQLLYGMMLYSWQGLKPWAVKVKALSDYREWAE